MSKSDTSKSVVGLKLEDVLKCVGSIHRWRMLVVLAKGEPLPASVIASRVKLSPQAASKHLVLMHDAGLIERGYGKLYRLSPRFLSEGGTVIHFGALDLHLDYADPGRK
jgi:DNA-binding transcriptional ArsR family regulator